MLNLNKYTKKRNVNLNQHGNLRTVHTCVTLCVCVSLCTTVVHNTAYNSSDYFPSYSPVSHHHLDAIYWRGEGCPLKRCRYAKLPPRSIPVGNPLYLFCAVKIHTNGGFRVNNKSKTIIKWAASDHLGELIG